MTSIQDRIPSLSGKKTSTFRADDVRKSQEFRKEYEGKLNVVLAEDMPWENSADGLIKHLVHHKMDTREMCVEAYMQFLKAGDVMIVENGCVHQHFNDSPDEEAVLLVFKAKPLFLFMHLLFQKIVEWPSKIPPKGAENYKPPADI